MVFEKMPTGIADLDPLIGGGFNKGSLILVAGNAGSGKTILAAHFLHYGAKHGEHGVYVSFAEDSETFRSNMLGLGLDFKALEDEGKLRFLDLVTTKEAGVSAIMERILSEIHSVKAERLVIDPFTVLAQAFKEKMEARVLTHTILGKITKQLGCTTMLVVEVPIGQERVGLSIEEFVADTIIELSYDVKAVSPRRRILVRKMRGVEHSPYSHDFIIQTEKGITVLPIYRMPKEKIEEAFSTGVPSIDRLLGGGIPYGSFYLFEVDAGIDENAFEVNFLRSAVTSKEIFVYILNSNISPADILRDVDMAGFRNEFDESVKKGELIFYDPFDRVLTEKLRQYIIPIVGFSAEKINFTLENMFKSFWSKGRKVVFESNTTDMINVMGLKTFLQIFPRLVSLIKEYEGAWLSTVNPLTQAREIVEKVRTAADGIIKIWREGSYNFIQVVKSKKKVYSEPVRYIETDKPPFIEIVW